MGFIYKISNSQTPSVYIGKTEGTIEKRWKEHLKQARNNTAGHLYNAIRLYGEECFEIQLIEECNNDILDKRESYWIKYYDSFNHGYNMTLGGEGRTKYDYKILSDKYLELKSEKETAAFFNCSKIVVQHACEAYGIKITKGFSQEYWNSEKGQKHREQIRELGKQSKGKKLSKETKQKISKNRKGKAVGEANPFYGKTFSEEHKQKLIKNSAWAKKIKCVETGIIYSSACQAAKAVGLKSSSGISKCALGERQTAGGFHWLRVEEEGENDC